MFLLTVGLVAQTVIHFIFPTWNVLYWTLWVIIAGTALTAALRIGRMYGKAK